MEGSVKSALEYFFPGDCYQTVVEESHFTDGQCLKLACSRLLSLTVIGGALIVKVPQIVKVLRAGSAEGLSYIAFILELLAATFTCTYNNAKGFRFSAWGESFFIAVQLVVLLLLMYYYNNQFLQVVALVPVYMGGVWYLTSGQASMATLGALQASVIPLLVFSRATQIYTTYSNQSVGQLSFITSLMNWAGTASRIFTTIQETGDTIILLMFVTNFIMNGVILIQFYLYGGKAKDEKKD